MGTRGPLPTIRLTPGKPLNDLTPPDWLGEAARDYWKRHAEYLVKNGLLTDQTAETFALHCDMWGRLRAMADQATTRSFLDARSAFFTSAKFFRLVPCDKPGAPVDRHEDKPVFDFNVKD